MIGRKRLIAAAVVGAGVIVGCDSQRSTSPTAPSAASLSASSSGASPSFSRSSSRSGVMHLIKECPKYNGQAGSYCTITKSDVKAIDVGTRVVYAQALNADGHHLDSDVTLDTPGQGNNNAFGHVTIDLAVPPGLVTFSGGTGEFKHFHAVVVVSANKDGSWNWIGEYSFSDNGGKGNDRED